MYSDIISYFILWETWAIIGGSLLIIEILMGGQSYGLAAGIGAVMTALITGMLVLPQPELSFVLFSILAFIVFFPINYISKKNDDTTDINKY